MIEGTKTKTSVTVQNLLMAWKAGNESARDELFNLLYHELRKLSASILTGEGHISLSTGDLVNEAVIRLIGLEKINWQDKAHFMALASRMMRRVLVDHARKKNANKRDHHKVTLITLAGDGRSDQLDIVALDTALMRLSVLDAERASIVEMRYYGGLSVEDIASVTGKSVSTVKRNWRSARAWLLQAISETL